MAGAKALPIMGFGSGSEAGAVVMGLKPMLSKVRERETGEEAGGQRGLGSGDSGLWVKTELNGGHHLVGLVSVLLAVAVDAVT